MVAMDTKFWRIYCAISDIRVYLHFQLNSLKKFSDRNETYGKELMGVYKLCLRISNKKN